MQLTPRVPKQQHRACVRITRITEVDAVVKKCGLEGVSNYWCEEVPLFELKFASQDGLRRFLRQQDKVQDY